VSLFDICNIGSSSYLMPIGGFFIVLFMGWVFSKQALQKELSSGGRYKIIYYPFFNFIVKFVAPIAISMIFLSQIGIL
ncbi:MAG: sodium-dependent transporter, partial [Rikenellaceae bacterium]